MRLEIIKRLQTISATIQGLASGRTKLTDKACIGRAALRTIDLHQRLPAADAGEIDDLLHGWSDTVGFELFFARRTHPVGGPGGRQARVDLYFFHAMTPQYGLNFLRNQLHGRAPRIGWRDRHGAAAVIEPIERAHDP